jgi:hypothetical protein
VDDSKGTGVAQDSEWDPREFFFQYQQEIDDFHWPLVRMQR